MQYTLYIIQRTVGWLGRKAGWSAPGLRNMLLSVQ